MVTAVFQSNEDYARVYGLWQWDYGQELRIQGLDLPAAVEIHFALTETGGEAVTRVGVTKDGVTTVPIPDSMLEGAGGTRDYRIYAWVYLADPAKGETVKRITMQVRARPKPEAFEAPGDGELFEQAIEAVNDAAKRAEEASGKAAAAADDARGAAAQTAEHLEVVQGLTEQTEINADTVAQDKQAVAGMLSQVQSAVSEAALSAEAAKLSETAAGQAQTGAEAAEDTARQYAGEAEADRRAVAEDKQTVTQMREAVATDRQAVERTAAQFGQTAQDALTAIGQAQSTAVGAVKAEGQKQTTAVQEAGTQAVKDVATAKTEAVQAVTAEGDKQTKRVEEAAAGVEADREQINQNKADIAGLAEDMADLAPGIKITAAGTDISIKDAAEDWPFKGLWVFGRSEQGEGPSPDNPQEIESAGESGSIDVSVSGANQLKPNNHNVFCDFPLEANTVVTLMTNGKASEGGNIKFIGTDDSNIWFSIDKGQTRVCRSIGSKPVKGFYDLLTPASGLEYMLAVGDVKTYESYRTSQSITLSTPNGLPGIPVSSGGNYTDAKGQQWVCDEVDFEHGKYVQRIKKVVINSDTNITAKLGDYGALQKNTIIGRYTDESIKKSGVILCKELRTFHNWNKDEESAYTIEKGIDFRLSRERLGLGAETTNEQNKAAILKFLETTPLHFIVQLDTPVERDLTPEELASYKALRMYNPTTSVSNDAGAWMEATYIADTKTYIDNKFADLSKTILDTMGGT